MNEALPTTRSLWLSALAALLVLGLGAAAVGQESGGGEPPVADAVPSGQIGARAQALEAAGITIPFPQRDLHLRNLPELRDALKEVSQPDGPRAHDEPSS